MGSPRTTALKSKTKVSLKDRYHDALDYYRKRGGVLFLSYCSFWDEFPFPQQSLAYALVREAIPVTWLDGVEPGNPRIDHPSSLLKVKRFSRLPGHRFEMIERLNLWRGSASIQREIDHLGGDPVVWVQGGWDEALIQRLPYVDIYSVFDDPYRHKTEGHLCKRAKVILCQNSLAERVMAERWKEKTIWLPPPFVPPPQETSSGANPFPSDFPERRMGFIGGCHFSRFDFELFEWFVQQLPDWGFVLMGRTDIRGGQEIERLKKYANFIYFPFAHRTQTLEVWKRLDVSLLLYKSAEVQDGAFSIKALDSAYFGVPCIGTLKPVTKDISGYFPMTNDRRALLREAKKISKMPKSKIRAIYEELRLRMDPQLHLATAKEFLAR